MDNKEKEKKNSKGVLDFGVDDEFDLPWEEIFAASRGIDRAGNPMSTAALSIDDIKDPEHPVAISNQVIANGIFDIHVSGGCAVIIIDFLKEDSNEFESIKRTVDAWMANLQNPEKDTQVLTLTMIPLIFQGMLFIVYNNLVFTDSYVADDYCRLILCFDNMATVPVVSDEIDYRQIFQDVEMELQQMEEKIQQDIDMYEEQKKSYENNPFDEKYKEQFGTATVNLEFESDESETENQNVRFTGDDNNEMY